MPHGQQRWGGYAIRENGLWLSDVTTGDVSITRHGLAPKLPNDSSQFLNGVGAWAVPPSGVTAVLFDSTLGADAATIDTGGGGISGAYKILEIFCIGRTDEAVTSVTTGVQFNADSTAANYPREYQGVSNATNSIGNDATVKGVSVPVPGTTADANICAVFTHRVPAYAGTTFYKAIDTSGGISSSTAAQCQSYQITTTWKNTAAITQVTWTTITAGKKLLAGSRMIIYGR